MADVHEPPMSEFRREALAAYWLGYCDQSGPSNVEAQLRGFMQRPAPSSALPWLEREASRRVTQYRALRQSMAREE